MGGTGEGLREGLERSVAAFGRLLSGLPGTAALTAGGVWSVRETAVHVIAATRLYATLTAGRPSPIRERRDYDPFNAGAFVALAERDPTVLAQLARQAADDYLAAIRGMDLAEPRPMHYGRDLPLALHVALLINEYLMHGTDIARAGGTDWSGDEAAARLAWSALAPWLTPARFLPDAAGELDATITVRCDGQPPLTFRVRGGALTVAQDDEPDCVIAGRAMPLLRWYFGRDPWGSGQLTATGPRAGLAERFGGYLRAI